MGATRSSATRPDTTAKARNVGKNVSLLPIQPRGFSDPLPQAVKRRIDGYDDKSKFGDCGPRKSDTA